MNKLIQFLKEVKQEVKKITWPTKSEVIRYSAIVVAATFIVAVYLGGVDYIVTTALDHLI